MVRSGRRRVSNHEAPCPGLALRDARPRGGLPRVRSDIVGAKPSHSVDPSRHAFPASRRNQRPSFANHSPSGKLRAQRRPGAGRARGPPAAKKAGGSHHRSGRARPAFPARRLERLIRGLPGAPGLLATMRDGACARSPRDTSIGVSGPHDFAVRNEPFVGATQSHAAIPCAHRIPPPTSRDGRDTPLHRKQDGIDIRQCWKKEKKKNSVNRKLIGWVRHTLSVRRVAGDRARAFIALVFGCLRNRK